MIGENQEPTVTESHENGNPNMESEEAPTNFEFDTNKVCYNYSSLILTNDVEIEDNEKITLFF